eukprot:gene46620-58130_t
MSRANTADPSRMPTSGQNHQGGLDDAPLSAHEEAIRAERERNQKEEDDFLKMENAFMTELSLQEQK